MEKRDSVDQRRQRVEEFVAKWRSSLGRQGAIIASYRQRGQRRLGPYYRLVCRDDGGKQHSVYLGPPSALVDEMLARLQSLQAPERTRRVIALASRRLRQQLKDERQTLDGELAPLGLHRKGSEIRGWRTARRLSPVS